ncbi:MAG TPA: hypothetical protein VFS62_17530 [Chloroflexota bacterium]|nr:hypothetical protein [Chloroflexota bacterium]
MKSPAARQALDHFLAAAAIGLALTVLGEGLPLLATQQQALPPSTAGYAALSLLTALGMGLYSYLKGHQTEAADQLGRALDAAAIASVSAATDAQGGATTDAKS